MNAYVWYVIWCLFGFCAIYILVVLAPILSALVDYNDKQRGELD